MEGKMEKTRTKRGFALIEFTDRYGSKCRLQKSSLATENAIWFGAVDANPQIMVSDAIRLGLPCDKERGWCTFAIPEEVSLVTDMHLTQDQVRELLPHLIQFAETGEL